MCRAGPAPRNNKSRRVSLKQVSPCDETLLAATTNAAKNVALHEKCVGTLSTADASSQGSSSYQQQQSVHEPLVTGSYADILEDYHVFPRVLGSGHYGCVRECVHRRTRQIYAVKTIDKSKIARLDHLRREVSLLKNMNHENVMRMIDCYEDQDYVHIVTEKYDGGELFDKIVDNTTDFGCLAESTSKRIIKSLLEAVAYLHSEGIAHRDIKPENILFESTHANSDIKLIDFGLSRKHNQGDAPMSTPVGTAYYMSPELLKGKYDLSCDIWSVGIVTYILLCGYPPFNGNTDPEIFDAIKRGHFDFPTTEGVFSEEAKDFIKCLLRRDPRKRLSALDALKHSWLN